MFCICSQVNVGFWHFSEVADEASDFRLGGESRLDASVARTAAFDAVDGAHSAASSAIGWLRRNEPLEGSRPWARLARSVSISGSRFFKSTAWTPMGR